VLVIVRCHAVTMSRDAGGAFGPAANIAAATPDARER
jgi:hypothetical protein